MRHYKCIIIDYCSQREVSDRWLAYESSPVDWCEDNYAVSGNIAEFTNTISNFLLILLPAVAIRSNIWHNYIKYVSVCPYVIFYFIIVIGFGSCYFHGTLSLLGQFIDEIALAWGLVLSYMFFLPNEYRPKNIPHFVFIAFCICNGIFMSYLWFIDTKLYGFWLMPLSFPIVFLMIRGTFFNKCQETRKFSIWTLTLYVISLTFWFVDQFQCRAVKSIGLPGLHNLWHISMGWATYIATTVFAYWKADADAPHIQSKIKVFLWGIPYVHCEKL